MNPYELLASPTWLDQQIGSVLEAWLTRDTAADQCRFCNKSIGDDRPPADRFCSTECEDAFEQVQDARIAIGQRDLDQRGFD